MAHYYFTLSQSLSLIGSWVST